MPLNSNYVLSLNDEIEVLLSGSINKVISGRINLSGSLFIPDIGTISLVNLNLTDANKKLSSIVSEKFVGTTSLISVKQAAAKKITIIGAVKKPGTYLVNPYVSISEAIKYAAGLNEDASLRNIIVTDISGTSTNHDLYRFLMSGNRSNDLSLRNGDTVYIPSTDKFFLLFGEVNQPMQYEYLSSDRYQDLLDFGSGLKRFANLNRAFAEVYEKNVLKTKLITDETVVGDSIIQKIYVPYEEILNYNL